MHILQFLLIGLFTFNSIHDDWIRIKGPDHLSFLFPNYGQRMKKEVDNTQSWIFQTKNLTCVFGVVCTKLDKEEGNFEDITTAQLYKQMKKETLRSQSATLKEEKNIPAKDMEVKDICYTFNKDGEEMTYYKRFIFRNNCMYQIVIGGKSKLIHEILAQKETFFDSISFNPKL